MVYKKWPTYTHGRNCKIPIKTRVIMPLEGKKIHFKKKDIYGEN